MRLAEGRFTRRVSNRSTRRVLQSLSAEGSNVMVFLGNPGCLQIHKGPVRNIVDWKGWLNVMDPGSEIHLNESGIAASWVVEKPTSDGHIYSLELFDGQGNDIASLFGVRTEGKRQPEEWKVMLARLPCEGSA
jgi:putative hemin transport protein